MKKNLNDIEHNQDECLEMYRLEEKFIKPLSVWDIANSFSDFREIAIRVSYDITLELKDYYEAIKKEPLLAEFIKLDKRYNVLMKNKKFISITGKNQSGRKELDIKKARQVPIDSLMDFENKKILNNRIHARCPFHHEKTPSFVIYKDQNSFHCFGCGKTGSVIDFVMNLYKKNFVEAVKYLSIL